MSEGTTSLMGETAACAVCFKAVKEPFPFRIYNERASVYTVYTVTNMVWKSC